MEDGLATLPRERKIVPVASLLEKARIIVLSNMHGLLDRVIDMNDIGAVRQYVRDVEDARDETREAKAVARGNRDTAVQEKNELEARMKELQGNIDFLITDGDDSNDAQALPLQTRLEGLKNQLKIKQEAVVTAEDLYSKLSDAEVAVSAKYESMKARLGELETLSKAAAAKNSAAKSLNQAAGILAEGTDGDIDDVAGKIRREANVSDARLDQAMVGIDGGVEKDINLIKAKQALEERKQALRAASNAAASPIAAPA